MIISVTRDFVEEVNIMAKIVILNGSPRKNGKTASLVKAFIEGAESVGNEVKELYLQGMNIGGCLACEGCQRNGGTCVQKDDMKIVSEAFLWADVVVFASPQYWGTITGQLKIVIDRLYAVLFGSPKMKQFVVIMTARGNMYEMTEDFFSIFTRFLGWENLGNVLGAGKEVEAQALGASIK
jgi:multimeric flavodoxin WrbA